MFRRFVATTFIAITLSACTPTFNWRQVQMEQAALSGVLPCKPDVATREVVLGTATLAMQMLGCKAGDATFTLAAVQVASPAETASAVAQWQLAAQRSLGVSGALPAPQAFALAGSTPVAGTGKLFLEGAAVRLTAVWLVRGTQVFQAAIYSPVNATLSPDVPESFFTGLRLP